MAHIIDDNRYIALYCCNYFLTGMIVMSLGPMVPFLARKRGLPETDLFFLFTCKSLGCFLGAVLFRVIKKLDILPPWHRLFVLFLFLKASSTTLFTVADSTWTQAVTITCVTCMNYSQTIHINTVILMTTSQTKLASWMSIAHASFGVGGILGPFLTSWTQQNTYLVIGLLHLLLIVPFLLLESPGQATHNQEHSVPQIQGNQLVEEGQQQIFQPPSSLKIEVTLCLMLFVFNGMEVVIGAWLPTYVVNNHLTDAKEGTRFNSLYWVVNTVMRLVQGQIQSKMTLKVKVCVGLATVVATASTCLTSLGYYLSTAYCCSMALALCLSPLYPLVLSIPSEYGIHYTSEQTANILFGVVLSDGFFNTIAGLLMSGGHINRLFVYLLGMSIASCLLTIIFFRTMKEYCDSQVTKQEPVPRVREDSSDD